ncbi:hypothetical protein SAMN05421842_12328 [Clostridium uliginosum]|uniref:Uncharacterized protein n=1 Tax=Clostridium uliginosum TaxID=119641 RepID=A0A1I1Q4B4_9CLOT|nr:hypothetical protein SAMN05421842_12328 [Clostridium uliginosum]
MIKEKKLIKLVKEKGNKASAEELINIPVLCAVHR